MKDCIFCEIVKGRLGAEIIYEDMDVIAILDIFPANKGHALVIPRNHFVNLLDTPDRTLTSMINVSKKISESLVNELGAGGFNLLQNNNPVAGQVIHHVHFHLIPRFEGDNVNFSLGQSKYEDGEIKEYGKKIRKALQQTLKKK